jgi:hypothetical protein
MTDSTSAQDPERSETNPPAANQPVDDTDLDAAGGAGTTRAKPTETEPTETEPTETESVGAPVPTPVPVAAPHGGQVPPGKPDGEVDTRP